MLRGLFNWCFNPVEIDGITLNNKQIEVIRRVFNEIPFEVWNELDLDGISSEDLEDLKFKIFYPRG